jgi:ABC-type sugar transport system substrate-binding protein
MNHSVRYYSFLLIVVFSFFSCSHHNTNEIKIGFSQAMSTDDWRKQMNSSMKIEASLRPEVDLTISDAQNNIQKQISDIEKFISQNVDVIIVSPIESKPLTAIVEKSLKAGIPVLVIDRKIDGENYTAYIGADNIEIGRIAARYIISHSKGQGLKVRHPLMKEV